MAARLISPGELFAGQRCHLRLLTTADCSERYLGWLRDPEVSRYLETRWQPQTLETVREFVAAMEASPDSYLFAILVDGQHVGNIKVGPIHPRHAHADVSYFIGERAQWGKGIATDAIRVATRIAFERLGLHRVQAGLYEGNVGSARALEKAGYRFEGRFRRQLRGPHDWEDHLWYGLVVEDARPARSDGSAPESGGS